MKQLFPVEIIHNSAENFYFRQQTSSRLIYLILLMIVILLLLLLPIITVDITVQNNGIIRSRYDDNILQSAVYGEVIRVNIYDDVTVKQADTLLVISTQKIDEQINYYNLQLIEESIHLKDLAILLKSDNSPLVSTLFRQEFTGFQGKLQEQKVKMAQVDKEFVLAATLYEKKVIPKMEYEEKKNNREYQISCYNNICEQQKLIWQTKYSELNLKIEGLKSSIVQLQKEKKQYILTAPISGTITAYSGIKESNFIVPNQQIARISPDDELLVECYVNPSNIGLIHRAMDVRFQFHSFNYNQWGIGSGKVSEISNNTIIINEHAFFKVKCSLDQNYLSLKNGYKGYLKKGMTLTGRFMITERTLFQLLYDKTDNWLNPKISENER